MIGFAAQRLIGLGIDLLTGRNADVAYDRSHFHTFSPS
jgi:hypothetical protein